MSSDDIAALTRVAARIEAGEDLTTDLMGQEGVPVALRLVIAAVTLAAADMPVNKKSITTIAPAARSATYRDHADLLDQAKAVVPALVQAQLGLAGAKVSAADLARQLEAAHATIEKERRLREEAEERLKHVAAYARELHWQLKPEYEARLREREEKVRYLHLVPGEPDENEPGIGEGAHQRRSAPSKEM
ncbi:hypothetical protein [Symbioplanes lichenis]|uniref:hypothetical protein n=1 Tax=Symbioplanes lichenis TaxID=1629072 RepID=UPI002739555D|nr:hypothetical protein [Actinoplanes lichenis]